MLINLTMKIKNIALLLFLIIAPFNVFSQNNYYVTDSTTAIGSKIESGGSIQNSKVCCVIENGKSIWYTPYQVKEYGLKDGSVYVAKDVFINDSIKRVFLERFIFQNVTLYYYRGNNIKTFFVEKYKMPLLEIPRISNENKTYKESLRDIMSDCLNISDAIKVVRYNKTGLKKLFSRYKECSSKSFPFFKFGLKVGYEALRLEETGNTIVNLNQIDFKYEGSPTVGAFIDWPILLSDFSLYLEAYYSKHKYSYSKTTQDDDIDYIANVSSIKIPILLKYTCPSKKLMPYINGGMIFAYNIKNESALFDSKFELNTVKDNIQEIMGNVSPLISKEQLGYSIGGGVEYKLNYKRSLFLDLRYSNLVGLSDGNKFNSSIIHLSTGINF